MNTDNRSRTIDTLVTQLVSDISAILGSTEDDHWGIAQASIPSEAALIADENSEFIEDSAGERWITESSIILSTYRFLRTFVDEGRALELLGNTLSRPFRDQIVTYIETRIGITQNFPEDAFRLVSDNFKSRGEAAFGCSFRYTYEVRDQDRVFVNIERCLFNEFFQKNGSPEVTPVMCPLCELDYIWVDELSKPKYKIGFYRPTTLAQGDDACHFQFTRTNVSRG